MSQSSRIFLFSKTSYPGVNHVPLLQVTYFQPAIDFSSYDYIIATSKEVFSALNKIGSWKHLPVLAVSDATAAAAKREGAELLDIAHGYGASLALLIKEKYSDLKGLYPHAEVVAFEIHKALQEENICIDSFVVYQTSCSQQHCIELPPDAICIFTSPSSVQCFKESYRFLPTYKIVCIGETTRASLPKEVKSVIAEKTSVSSAIKRAESLEM